MERMRAICLACLVAAGAVAGEAAGPAAKKPAEPAQEQLEVWAARVVYNGDQGTFLFSGNVTVIKGDLRVDCARMEGLIDAKTRKITKVSATGGVRMLSLGTIRREATDERPPLGKLPKDAWQATCGKADYDLKAGRLVMSGKSKEGRPRLTRGEGYGEADMIVFVPDKGEYELIGSPVIRGTMETGPVRGTAGTEKHKPTTQTGG